MQIGKVPNEVLKRIILDKIKYKRDDIIIRPKIGEDCSAVDFGSNICVITMDPITGTENKIGKLAVHISCNDIASCGVEPLGLMVTILAPPDSTEKKLETLMSDLCEAAESLNVEILGGHTEITSSVNRFVIITTAIGKTSKERLITTSGAKPGDFVVMTKSAGIEGTSILASEKEKELVVALGIQLVENAKNYINNISVVKEGIIAGEFGVSAMHDVTEGGILGAAWELAEASNLGITLYKKNIPVSHETKKITEIFNIDPLKLISSGCMVMTCSDGDGLVKRLKDNGIHASVIGMMTVDKKRILNFETGFEKINQPETDELFKVI